MKRLSLQFLNKPLKILWLGTLSAAILSNPMLSYPGRDSGIFLYIGWLILKGKLPYVDAWENKGPLVFYLNALGLWLTGGSRWGIWLLEFFFVFGAAYLLYRAMKFLPGEAAALVGASVFFVAAGNVLQGGNFSEEYSLLFSAAAVFFFLNESKGKTSWGAFFVGITLGLNLLLRPNNISAQAAIAATYALWAALFGEWKALPRRAFLMAAGMSAILAPVLLYFHWKGALTEMINAVVVFNSQYSEGVDLRRVGEGAFSAANGIGFGWVGLALLGYALSAFQFLKNKQTDSPQARFLPFLLIGFPVEALFSAVSGKNYPHYFIGWSLYVGMLCGYAVSLLVVQLRSRTQLDAEKYGFSLALILIFLTVFARLETWQNYAAVLAARAAHRAPIEYRDPVADYIEQHTSPGDKILVWGFRPIVNFAARREAPVVYLPYPLSHVESPLARRWADEFYAQLQANPPALIINMIEEADRERIPDLDPQVRKNQKIKWKDVVLAHNYQEVVEFIAERYLKTDVVNGYDVYRLKDGGQ